jgi:glycerophosphoryl diester phosphodiesterase
MKKLFLLAFVLPATALLAADACEGLEKSRFYGRMGEMVEVPENTLRAYRFAIDNGFPVEIDLFATKDGELVAVNDENLKAKAKIGKHPGQCNWKGELENVDIGAWKQGSWMGNWKNAGLRIPRIGQILRLLPKDSVNQFHLRDGGTESARLLRKALDAQNNVREENVIVIGRNAQQRRIFPKAAFWLDCAGADPSVAAEKARAVGASGIAVAWDADKITSGFVGRCRKKGIAVNVLVGNDPKAALEALRRGADSVTGESAPYLFASACGYAAAPRLRFDERNIVAHRGESEEAPENTMPAFVAAAKGGFAIELDLYMSLDGEVFCTHDQRMYRKGCNLPMYEWTTNLYWKGQVENADAGVWMGEKWRGTKYPRLEEVLPLVEKFGVWMILEIKDPRKAQIMPKVERIVKSFPFLGPHNIVIAAGAGYMREYKITATCLTRKGWLADDEKHDCFGYVKRLDAKSVAMYAPRWDNLLLSEELVSAAHARGVKVSTWTVNDAGLALEAIRRGVDYVLSDRPNAIFREMKAARKLDGDASAMIP